MIGTTVVEKFEDDDLILAEYGATVVGMEILREKAEEIEEEARSKAVVQMAISSLSYSELEAIEHIFEELDGNEGPLLRASSSISSAFSLRISIPTTVAPYSARIRSSSSNFS